MTRNEIAHILAESLLAAGFTRNPDRGARSPWLDPDGYPATRRDLKSHVFQAYQGDDRDPFLEVLRPACWNHWPLVDKAALSIPARP